MQGVSPLALLPTRHTFTYGVWDDRLGVYTTCSLLYVKTTLFRLSSVRERGFQDEGRLGSYFHAGQRGDSSLTGLQRGLKAGSWERVSQPWGRHVPRQGWLRGALEGRRGRGQALIPGLTFSPRSSSFTLAPPVGLPRKLFAASDISCSSQLCFTYFS